MRDTSETDAILKRARDYCARNGLQMTGGRAAVLRAVVLSRRPVKAYDLLPAVAVEGRKPMPPIVYRALDFWVAHGFIHRIDSLNAYTGCTHPGCGHECQIFICSACGRASELCDEQLARQVRANAAEHGFAVEHLRIEVSGRCSGCRG